MILFGTLMLATVSGMHGNQQGQEEYRGISKFTVPKYTPVCLQVDAGIFNHGDQPWDRCFCDKHLGGENTLPFNEGGKLPVKTPCRWVTPDNHGGWTECQNARSSLKSRHCLAHQTPEEKAHLEKERALAEKKETEDLEKLGAAALAKLVLKLRQAAKQE